MSLLKIILQLLVFVFNKLSPEEKRIFYEINNKYQIEMLNKTVNGKENNNNNSSEGAPCSNLQKAVMACRRLTRIEDFGLAESFKENMSRSTLANQIMLSVCSNSFYYSASH